MKRAVLLKLLVLALLCITPVRDGLAPRATHFGSGHCSPLTYLPVMLHSSVTHLLET